MHAIQKARLERKLTQAQAARCLGLSTAAYRRIERGQRKRIPLSQMCRIADFYGKSLDELFRSDREGSVCAGWPSSPAPSPWESS